MALSADRDTIEKNKYCQIPHPREQLYEVLLYSGGRQSLPGPAQPTVAIAGQVFPWPECKRSASLD